MRNANGPAAPPPPWDGGCRCGAVRLRLSAPPLVTMACHCTGCQRMSSSAFSLSMAISDDSFAVTAGEPVLGGLKGPDARHFFCPSCMTWMFTRFDAMGPFVNVRPTMLDDPSWFEPFVETMTAEKLPWATTPARYRFAGFPSAEAFGPIAAEFADWSAARAG